MRRCLPEACETTKRTTGLHSPAPYLASSSLRERHSPAQSFSISSSCIATMSSASRPGGARSS
eukprot:10296904-Lingulodinium_polyedra.AAC.1